MAYFNVSMDTVMIRLINYLNGFLVSKETVVLRRWESDHFTCISTNAIYCITFTLCKKIYIGETGRRLADRFREHLRDVEKNNTDASKPVAHHFNLPHHPHSICGLSLHHGNTEARKSLE